MEKFNKRCVALYSGGLDSLLAIIVIKNLGFEVLPLFVKTPFYNKNEKDLKKQLAPLDLELFTIEDTEGYLEILKNPRFGYGKNLNPCIDCKIFFLKKAKEFMEETGASFVITGDVLGQRPMSQRSYTVLRTIEKHANLEGRVLRPLSARCLPETLMEKEGLIDREKLYCIQGRTRVKQLELAKQFGLEGFESPAGGCLLTDIQFSNRLREMLSKNEELKNREALELLRMGRHFRIDGYKFIVSRNEKETKLLLENYGNLPRIECLNAPGAIGVFLKEPHMNAVIVGASIVKRYSKKAKATVFKGEREFIVDVKPISDKELEKYRAGGNGVRRKT